MWNLVFVLYERQSHSHTHKHIARGTNSLDTVAELVCDFEKMVFYWHDFYSVIASVAVAVTAAAAIATVRRL